jgi:PncC family amidohydrolase
MTYFNSSIIKKAQEIILIAAQKNLKIVTAESCTGGLLSAIFTEISGSSRVFERGFVSYSNEAKSEILGVDPKIIEEYGAVSKETAQKMAIGALKNSKAQISLAITGIAGPEGGSQEKPVGLVYIAIADENKVLARKFNFAGSRSEIRKQAIIESLNIIAKNIA